MQTIPRHARKVKIDARFRSMFTDRRFKVKCTLTYHSFPAMFQGLKHLYAWERDCSCLSNYDIISFVLSSLDSVDRKGRRVKQTSNEDLRKYYQLEGTLVL